MYNRFQLVAINRVSRRIRGFAGARGPRPQERSLPARELIIDAAVDYLEGVSQEVYEDDVELKRELATGYDRVGDIRGGINNPSHGDLPDALEYYQKAKTIRKKLLGYRFGRH